MKGKGGTAGLSAVAALLLAAAIGLAAGASRDSRTFYPLEAVPDVSFRLDVNQAGRSELEALPGVGTVLAERILRDRNEKGPYRSIGELARVRGVGRGTVESLRSYVKAGEEVSGTVR